MIYRFETLNLENTNRQMKNIGNYSFFVLLLQFSFLLAEAQGNRPVYDRAMKEIQQLFNERQPDRIYEQASNSYKTRMPKEKFTLGMKKFVAKTGQMQSFSFVDTAANGYNYAIKFENSDQLFSILLDEEKKIIRMNFKEIPFVAKEKDYKVASSNPMKDSLDLWVEKFVRPYIQKENAAGIILAIIEGNKERKYSYGTTDKTIQALPASSESIFEIGSVTKVFTSLLLAKEVVEGKMTLNDPVNQYLPDSIPPLSYQNKTISLMQLSNHTSGLPRLPENIFSGNVIIEDPYRHYTSDSLFHYLKNYKVVAQPGSRFSYSNLGAGLLGVILERQNSKTFAQLLNENIFLALGMNKTSLKDVGVIQGYDERGKASSNWHLGPLSGSGAIRSTLDDMIIFMKAQLGSKNNLANAIELSHKETFSVAEQTMGLGWRIEKLENQQIFYHSGGTGGFRSFVAFNDKQQKAIVILSNTAVDVTNIGFSILEQALND